MLKLSRSLQYGVWYRVDDAQGLQYFGSIRVAAESVNEAIKLGKKEVLALYANDDQLKGDVEVSIYKVNPFSTEEVELTELEIKTLETALRNSQNQEATKLLKRIRHIYEQYEQAESYNSTKQKDLEEIDQAWIKMTS